jgi:hypothetical protein
VAEVVAVNPAWYMTLPSVVASNICLGSTLPHCLVGLVPALAAGLVLAVVLVAGLAAGLVVALMIHLIYCPCSCLNNLTHLHCMQLKPTISLP